MTTDEQAPNFYTLGGTLKSDDPSYVRRQADEDLYRGLDGGDFCYVLTSRQMGKSSLMVQTAARLRAEGVAVAVLDLTAIGQNLTAEQWYDGLLNRVGRQLGLEDELEDFWLEHDRLGPLQRWTRAIREVVLEERRGRVVIFVDEIDAVRNLPFSTDEFFAAVREFYNRRTEDAELSRLTFCLLGVATPSDLIRDVRTTPFNIGRRIELNDFDEDEASPLVNGLGRPQAAGAALLHRILYWTGGHPYLTQRLCQAVAEDQSVNGKRGVDRLCESLFLSSRARERDDNLLFVRERILRSEADRAGLLDLYLKARDHKRVCDDETSPLVSVLRLSGITRAVGGCLRVRNRVYYRVFDKEWVTANMPDAELQRQRAAYRRGMIRAASIAAAVLLVMGVLAVWAVANSRRANSALAEARRERVRAEAEALRANQALAEAERERAHATRMQGVAEENQDEAERERKEAEQRRREAIRQKEVAEQQRAEAERQRRQAVEASQQREVANRKRTEAEGLAQSATEQKRQAEEEGLRTRRLLYAMHMTQAQRDWDEANIARVQKLLSTYDPALQANNAGERDVRGFEWFRLSRLAHRDISSARLIPRGDNRLKLTAFSRDLRRAVILSVAEGAGSPDGNSATVKVWDVAARRPVVTLATGKQSQLTAVAISPDGKVAVTGHEANVLKVWDASTGKELAALGRARPGIIPAAYGISCNSTPQIDALAFSPDGRTLASIESNDKCKTTLKLLDLASMRELATAASTSIISIVSALSFSPDGRVLAVGENSVVKLFDMPARGATQLALTPPAQLAGHEGHISFVAFSPDGKTLAAGSNDSAVKLWDVATRERLGPTFQGHSKSVTFIAFSPDSKKFATGGEDRMVNVWEVPEKGAETTPPAETETRELGLLPGAGAAGWMQGVSYAPGRQAPGGGVSATRVALASFPAKRAPRVEIGFGDFAISNKAATPLSILKGHDGSILSVAFLADGKTLDTFGADGVLKTWDVNAEPEWANVGKFEGVIFGAAFSPDSKTLATGSGSAKDDKNVKLWDAATGRESFGFKAANVNNVAFSPDGRVLAAACGKGELKLWNVVTRQEIATLSQPPGVFSVAFSRDGLLASGGENGSVLLWDVAAVRKVGTLEGHTKGVEALSFSPDGRTLATASHDGTARLWEVATGREVARFSVARAEGEPAVGLKAVAFSPDGQTLAVGGIDNLIHLWDVAARQEVATLEGHARPITFVSFSRDGKRIVSSSVDETVRLWDTASRQEVAVLKGHTKAVWVATFSPDGNSIATSSEDLTVKLWRAAAP